MGLEITGSSSNERAVNLVLSGKDFRPGKSCALVLPLFPAAERALVLLKLVTPLGVRLLVVGRFLRRGAAVRVDREFIAGDGFAVQVAVVFAAVPLGDAQNDEAAVLGEGVLLVS